MKLSYEIIRKIHRLEREYVDLVKLEDDFFDSLKSYIDEEKERLKAKKDFFDNSLTQELFNIKNMLEQIINLRQKKIINKAILFIQTGEENIDNLLLPEQKIYRKLVKILEQYHDYVDSLFNENKAKNMNLKKIIILKEVPKFMGTDMQEYGPYVAGEEVELPNAIAKIFLDKEIAKEKGE